MDSHYGKMTRVKLFGGGRPIHDALGGGKVADLLLWKDKKVSGAVLAGVAVVWFLFEIIEYNFITLLCHITITAMSLLFIWCTIADLFNWPPPEISRIILRESSFYETVSVLRTKFNQFLSILLYVACGKEPKLFFLAVFSLWMISMIGNCISTLNLVFFGLLCLETLPFLYEKYEEQVDYIASGIYTQIGTTYKKLETEILGKIPRAPIKNKDS